MSGSQVSAREVMPVHDYIRQSLSPISKLAHSWEFHAALRLTPAEERTIVREPARAAPEALAARLGKLRVIAVPFIGCFETGDAVCFSKPSGEGHTVVWMEALERTNVVIACRELDAHDTGFEFLASIAQLASRQIETRELASFTRIIEEELHQGIAGELDKEALEAKEQFLKFRGAAAQKASQFEKYRDVSIVSTLAAYMHGLWHDVQIGLGPEHLPVAQLRRRMSYLAELFPPNTGYSIFAREFDNRNT